MKGKIFKILFCSALLLVSTQISAQGPDINSFFGNLKNKVIDGANQLAQWKNEADAAASKTASNFTDCPSTAAQNLYNDLKQKRDRANQVKREAEDADRQGQDARSNCRKVLPGNVCDAAYNELKFRGIATTAGATSSSLEAAINALKSLKCVSGCNRAGKIYYPKLIEEANSSTITTPGGYKVLITNKGEYHEVVIEEPKSEGGSGFSIGSSQRRGGGATEISYCAAWDPGQFQASWDTGTGNFADQVLNKLPKCKEIRKTSCCASWDLSVVLPKLQKANLVPAEIKVADLTVEIPKKNITAISELKAQSCSQPIKICKRAGAMVTLDSTSNPLTATANSCQEWVEIGCASPVFGFSPVTATIQVPDNTRVKISWKGIKVKSGSVEVDMTKPEFITECYQGCKTTKNLAQKIQTGSEVLTWVCLEPRFVNVVTNQ